MRHLILLGAIACIVPIPCSAQQTQQHIELRVGLVNSGESAGVASTSIARGVRLGAAEAKQTARLFGDDVQFAEAAGAAGAAVAAANRLLSSDRIEILIGTSAADAEALSRFAEAHHILFFNASSRSQLLRSACNRYTFHIEATDAMYASAAHIAGTVSGSAARPQSARTVPDSIVLWSAMLERFGASQINARYRNDYGTGMDGSGWAGWAAVKFGAEAALRARSTSPARLLAYLESPTTQFDGHKGWPLTFRRSDHQLRQPLYLIPRAQNAAGRRVVKDVPELHGTSALSGDNRSGRASDRTLDSLISSPKTRACPWSDGR
jgi:ABC-type branched-subunit amino acid transport system substrate-binding protein